MFHNEIWNIIEKNVNKMDIMITLSWKNNKNNNNVNILLRKKFGKSTTEVDLIA